MRNEFKCPICGNFCNYIIENKNVSIVKLRHPAILFSNKEVAEKFTTRCYCVKCNIVFNYNIISGYSIENTKVWEQRILSAIWSIVDKNACCQDAIELIFEDKNKMNFFLESMYIKFGLRLTVDEILYKIKNNSIVNIGDFITYIVNLKNRK